MNPTHPVRFLILTFAMAILQTGSPAAGADSANAKKLFAHPPRQYSTGPLWVWNDLLTEDEIRDTLRDLAAQHVRQVWVHPRPGLMTPYLSTEWFRLWKVALWEAERLDMNVWIYDENSYPSGFAGGLVPEAMPESRGRGLVMRETKTPPAWSSDLVGVYRLEADGFTNLTAQVQNGVTLPEAQYVVAAEVRSLNSPWHGNRCYVNLLSPGVTEKFLELTMEPYRREIGAQFGHRVPGVFTDEPNIRPAGGLPWSELLAQAFQKRWGYDLLGHLPSLTRPVGDWQRIRHNYFQVLNEQFIEHWSRPCHDYYQRNHLEWTGHYWDHEWPNCVGVPDNMAMYAWHQRPAIDCLMNQYAEHTHAQFGNVRMVKELASIANQLGLPRTLCETYGAGGWDLRFEDMKRIGDWLEVLGVNTINQHLSYVTLRGARKRDHPQSFSYHEPWWEAYHVSADYLARLSAALSQGEQFNRLLVLEPTTTAWMYQGDEAKLKQIGDSFFKLLMTLEAAQVEYDIGCEDVLARHGSAGQSGLSVGRRLYQNVLVPEFTQNLNARTARLLTDFTQAGGTVLSCGEAPTRIDGLASTQALALAKSPQWKTITASAIVEQFRQDSFAIERQADDKGILFHHRRQLDDGELLLLVNTSIVSPSAGLVESDLHGAEEWDLYTGKTRGYPFERNGKGIKVAFKLPPSGSLLLFLTQKTAHPAPASAPIVNVIKPQGSPEAHRLAPNVLTLDYVDVIAGGESRTNLYCYKANQFIWKKNGVERDPWDSAVQFKDELITKTFSASSGFRASYRFTIQSAVPTNLAIVLERPDLYTISCNGQPVSGRPDDWWLDKAFGRVVLGRLAQVGENVVTIENAPFTMFSELEPAYLLGDFSLQPAESGFVVVPDRLLNASEPSPESAPETRPDGQGQAAGSGMGWNAQGLPFYSGGVAYREVFDLPRVTGSYRVALPQWRGSVAKVTANGMFSGYVDAPPWECDVTKQLHRGRNVIEVTVIGTLKNTLGPHHGNPPLGAAWPSGFQRGPDPGPPPGAKYDTVGYGLFSQFVLKEVTAKVASSRDNVTPGTDSKVLSR